MYLGGDKFLHAPHTGDVVKVSSLDEPYYAQQFAGGRRFDQGAGVAAAPAAAAPRPRRPRSPRAVAAAAGRRPAIDPTEVAKAQAAVARDAAEVRRNDSQLFLAIKAVEATQGRENAPLGDVPQGDRPVAGQARPPRRGRRRGRRRRAALAARARRAAPRRAGAGARGRRAGRRRPPPEAAGVAAASIDLTNAATDYPGNNASQAELAKWLAKQAQKAGLPPELPVMASLVESGVKNLNFGDRDSVGFFQMRVGIWNQGAYAGYPEKPELQAKWFIDQALAVKRKAIAGGDANFGKDPSKFGEWIADVERPAEQYRGRYQLRLGEARKLLGGRARGARTPPLTRRRGGVAAAVAAQPLAAAGDAAGAAAAAGRRCRRRASRAAAVGAAAATVVGVCVVASWRRAACVADDGVEVAGVDAARCFAFGLSLFSVGSVVNVRRAAGRRAGQRVAGGRSGRRAAVMPLSPATRLGALALVAGAVLAARPRPRPSCRRRRCLRARLTSCALSSVSAGLTLSLRERARGAGCRRRPALVAATWLRALAGLGAPTRPTSRACSSLPSVRSTLVGVGLARADRERLAVGDLHRRGDRRRRSSASARQASVATPLEVGTAKIVAVCRRRSSRLVVAQRLHAVAEVGRAGLGQRAGGRAGRRAAASSSRRVLSALPNTIVPPFGPPTRHGAVGEAGHGGRVAVLRTSRPAPCSAMPEAEIGDRGGRRSRPASASRSRRAACRRRRRRATSADDGDHERRRRRSPRGRSTCAGTVARRRLRLRRAPASAAPGRSACGIIVSAATGRSATGGAATGAACRAPAPARGLDRRRRQRRLAGRRARRRRRDVGLERLRRRDGGGVGAGGSAARRLDAARARGEPARRPRGSGATRRGGAGAGAGGDQRVGRRRRRGRAEGDEAGVGDRLADRRRRRRRDGLRGHRRRRADDRRRGSTASTPTAAACTSAARPRGPVSRRGRAPGERLELLGGGLARGRARERRRRQRLGAVGPSVARARPAAPRAASAGRAGRAGSPRSRPTRPARSACAASAP